MTCRDCLHYIDSAEANKPRYGLAGYGYCKAGATPELRAMFFPETQAVCLFLPSLFKKGGKP